MSQPSILNYFSKTTAPLPPPCSSRVGHAPPAKKRRVGRPRKVKRNSPAPETEREEKGSGELEASEDGKEKGSEEVQAGKEDGKGMILKYSYTELLCCIIIIQ